MNEAEIENGFAKAGSGEWLVGAAQPVAALGNYVQQGLRGWIVPDRAKLHCVKAEGKIWCASKEQPFLTHLTCAAPISVVSDRLLLAPASARTGASLIRIIPFNFSNAICVTECGSEWVVLATRSRLQRLPLAEGEILSVRPEAAVAWTTPRPTGFCPKIGLADILIPKKRNRNLMLHFYGPGIVWMEGADAS